MLSYFFHQRKVPCFGAGWEVACLDRVYFMSKKNVIFHLFLLLEDGTVEASIPGSLRQNTVNFLFNGKILP